jgi:hypothetical protein
VTDVLNRLRAADPAGELSSLLDDAQLQRWSDDGLRQVLSGAGQLAGVSATSISDDVWPATARLLPAQGRSGAHADRVLKSRPPAVPTSRRRPASRRWWIPAAGVAAAVALAVIFGLPGRTVPAVAATPGMLHYAHMAATSKGEASALAHQCLERQRARRVTPTAFSLAWREWSLSTRVDGEQVTSAVVPVQVSLTRQADGSAELVRRTSAPEFPNRAARERWVDAGRPAARSVTVQHQRWAAGGFTPEAAALPDDPARLLPALSQGHPIAELGDAEVLVAIADAYRSTQLSPAQQAALFAVAASRQGIEPFGRATDRAGRVGYALSVESDHTGLPTRYTAIFDPVTGRLLDLEQTLTRSAGSLNVPVPSTIGYTVFQ